MIDAHTCFGIVALGNCAYNPAAPTIIYFSIGDAIAALGFTLAIQQLFKPIYLFRVRAYGLKIVSLPLFVFAGALCTVVAMLLPNLPVGRQSALAYPITWELIGGFLIAIAYAAVAVISFLPVKLFRFNLESFSRAAARLLSEANEEDRIIFANDLLTGRNLDRLIDIAGAWRIAEMASAEVIFDELRRAGKPLQISGPVPISAFYLFTHRRELEAASLAGTMLRILSDPDFCETIVKKCSWLIAGALEGLSDKHIHTDQANPFVQEIARQAIESSNSMFAKESAYTGFRSMPVLSSALFSNHFVLRQFNPLSSASLSVPDDPNAGYMQRFGRASELMFGRACKELEFWQPDYLWAVGRLYESIGHRWSSARSKGTPVEFDIQLSMSVERIIELTEKAVERLEQQQRKSLYISNDDLLNRQEHRRSGELVEVAAKIVYESLTSVAKRFRGHDDPAWHHAHSLLTKAFQRFGRGAIGLTPFQQHLTIKLVRTLSENMLGWYPAIARVLLSVIGPYHQNGDDKGRTGFNILKDAVYLELQGLQQLSIQHPGKLSDYLPDNVTYDAVTNKLTHRYSDGSTAVTDLGALNITPVDLADEANWQAA